MVKRPPLLIMQPGASGDLVPLPEGTFSLSLGLLRGVHEASGALALPLTDSGLLGTQPHSLRRSAMILHVP